MPPVKLTVVFILIVPFGMVLVIVLPAMYIDPAVMVFTFKLPDPPPIWLLIYALIARCVGTTASESAVKNGSVLNSVTVAPPPPSATEPSDSSFRPARLNASAFNVAVPVACSTLNKPPTRKLPSWSVLVQNTRPPPNNSVSFAGIGSVAGRPG